LDTCLLSREKHVSGPKPSQREYPLGITMAKDLQETDFFFLKLFYEAKEHAGEVAVFSCA
jgi:hypothetical protein